MEAEQEGLTPMRLSWWLECCFLGIVKDAYFCFLLNLKVGDRGTCQQDAIIF